MFLSLDLNSKIPTYEELSKKQKVGRGTIKKAINYLISIDAIVLKTHGSSGTYIESKNIDALIKVLSSLVYGTSRSSLCANAAKDKLTSKVKN